MRKWVPILGRCLIVASFIGLAACASNDISEKWEPRKWAQAHVLLALDYLQRGKYEVAREELDIALEIDSRLDTAHHGKGLLFAQIGYVEEAKHSFARATRLNRSNYVAANDYGIFLCQNNEVEKGIKILQSVENKSENQVKANTFLGLGICHFAIDRYDDAKRYFRQVLKVAPRLPQALLPMAEISYAEANYLSARAFIERYLSTSYVSERALVLAADTELKLKDTAAAQQYASRLRRLYPSSPLIEQYRSLLN